MAEGYNPDRYEDLEPLSSDGHVVLVRDRTDGQLYVKKHRRSHAPAVYQQLLAKPVAGMPVLYGVWQEDAGLTVIEEYIPGCTLEEILTEEGPLPEKEIIAIGQALCGILRELHSRKPAIIHRDIKPGNIIRQRDGRIVLLDLSAAKPENPWQSRDTVLIGTPGYAAPEQYGFSASTVQTDLYALGVLLNVLRTGAMPWERLADGRLRRIIDRCMKLAPKDRYMDARELGAALKRAGQTRIEWFPPGFRSLKWYRMVPALCFYFVYWLVFLKFVLDVLMGESTTPDFLAAYLMMGMGPVLFYCNYLDVQRFFPFMRSNSRGLRLLGYLLFPLWLFLLMVAGAILGIEL